jgi:hypothetical protein
VPAVAELLEAIAAAPNLHGAACADHRALFDACLTRTAGPASYAAAAAVCDRCPVLAACAAWVDGLPPRARPFGVTAGVFRRQARWGYPGVVCCGPVPGC